MPSYNVHEAKTQLSRLLDEVLQGEAVTIMRNGMPVAELIPARKRAFPLGAGRDDTDIDPAAVHSDRWWQPMSEEEVESFLDGRY